MVYSLKCSLKAAVCLSALATAAAADVVTLKSFDDSISISGELLEFDGSKYVVRSPIGVVQVDALSMRCLGDACPGQSATGGDAETVRVAGSQSVPDDLVPALVLGYAQTVDADVGGDGVTGGNGALSLRTPAGEAVVDVALNLTDSADGLRALGADEADITISTRAANESEGFRIARGGAIEDRQNVLALDGVVIVNHPANPVRAISSEDLPAVFSGQISKWSDLGGFGADIKIYARASAAGTMSVFQERVMGPAGARLAPNVTILDSDEEISAAVARDPFAIGISSFSSLGDARAMAIRGTCGVQTPVNAFTIKTEEYPLTRRIYAYSSSDIAGGHGERMLDYALSDEGQIVVSQAGLVDQRITARPIDAQGVRLASAVMDNGTQVSFGDLREMMGDLVAGDRLSLTYRFEFGSSRLDSRALGDVERLANLLSTGDYANKEILLVGFTDAIGDPVKNRLLSQSRAAVVRDALLLAAPQGSLENIRIRAAGFGEASPLACNDTDTGRQINRRVEVWVSDLVRQASN